MNTSHQPQPHVPHTPQVVRCPSCKAFGYDDDDFCACCGAAMWNRCQACGTVVRHPVAFFCTRCGAELATTTQHNAGNGVTATSG